LRAYEKTGKASIIGVGRKVIAQTKSGDLIPIFLSITEKKEGDKMIFTGILHRQAVLDKTK